jgi:Tol biopolymer transport system component
VNRRNLLKSAALLAAPAIGSRIFGGAGLVASALAQPAGAARKGALLLNRIGPSQSELFIAKADGSDERKLLADTRFEYNARFSPDGNWIVFTSERNGDGQADIFRCRTDGTGLEPLVDQSTMDDAGALSPDGSRLAFVSTREGHRANIWIKSLKSGELRNLTGAQDIQGDPALPNGFFRPAWSPDGRWIAFSSDRNTDWRGHSNGRGWEHTQELSIYVVQADGSGFRRIASQPGMCLGTPCWSPDGREIAFYEMTTEDTWGARRPNLVGNVVSQIVSVNLQSGERKVRTSGPGLKLFPHYTSANEILYHRKGGADEGLYSSARGLLRKDVLRSPHWSADGKFVVYEKVVIRPRAQNLPLYSWDAERDYLHTDVFPVLTRDGKLVMTEKAAASSIVIMNPDGSDKRVIYDTKSSGLDPKRVAMGMAGAFNPTVSPDGAWIAFGLGEWFQARNESSARIMRVRRDGSGLEALTDGSIHSGFPSFSADGKQLVYRVWSEQEKGLRILDIESRSTRVLTNGFDNLPGWSPDGSRILFTRRGADSNFDIFTIRPDGSDLLRVTTSRAIDGHAVWTAEGQIMWNSGMHGFRDEAALFDNTFQQYGQIFIMNADGSGKRMITDSRWEDSMPLYIPASLR